jgi:hypothetical protein
MFTRKCHFIGNCCKPKSLIVREAIAQYAAREDALAADERQRLLGVLRRIKQSPPTRPAAAVDRELQEIRHSRRAAWRRGGGPC